MAQRSLIGGVGAYPQAVPIGGGFVLPGRGGANTTPAEAALYVYRIPYIFTSAGTMTFIGCHVNGSSGTTGCVLRIGLYADNQGVPGALLADFGTASCVGSAGNVTLTTAQPISAYTPYWLACAMQGSAVTRAIMWDYDIVNGPQDIGFLVVPFTAANNVGDIFNGGGMNGFRMGYVLNGVTGALPNPYGTPSGPIGGNIAPRLSFKIV